MLFGTGDTMSSALPWPFRRWRVALLLVVIACATPGRVSAECGDHVQILNATALDNGDNATSATTVAQSQETEKVPCSGPNCSRAPERHSPPYAPAPPTAPQGKDAARLLGIVDTPDTDSAPAGDFTSSLPVRRPSSIFHPPRAG